MKEFLLVFRADMNNAPQRSAEEAAASTRHWMEWIQGIAAKDKLADRGNRLDMTGKVLRGSNTLTNGPYSEIKESIGGYSIVKAESYDEAVEIAKGCPILSAGGSVEIRQTDPM